MDNGVVEVGALSDPDWPHLAPRSILEPICHVTGPDRLTVRLAGIDHNPLGSAMTLESLAQKAFGSGEVSPLAEPEFDRVTATIDRPVEIPPLASDLDVSFIDMPPAGDRALVPIEPIQQKRGVMNCPVVGSCLVAERCWDRVRWAIENYTWRFDGSRRPPRAWWRI